MYDEVALHADAADRRSADDLGIQTAISPQMMMLRKVIRKAMADLLAGACRLLISRNGSIGANGAEVKRVSKAL